MNAIPSTVGKLIKKKEVAQLLSCSLRHVERMVSAEKLTAIKVLGAVRFKLSEVEKIINKGTV